MNTNSPFFTGVIDDPRSAESKALDFNHEELLSLGVAIDPFTNEKPTSSPYPDEDQQQVGSCVPHGVGGALAIDRSLQTNESYQRLAWTFSYRLRVNYPQAGCFLQDIFEEYRTIGAPLFDMVPDPATEEEANAVIVTPAQKTEAAIFKGLSYVQFAVPNDIGEIANVIEQGKSAVILFFSTYAEWAREYPEIQNTALKYGDEAAEVHHCVRVLPKSGFTENGIRYIAIQDSVHFGGMTIRYVSEQFIAARVYGAGYWIAPAVLGTGPLPSHTFTQVLKQGMKNKEVTMLQSLLIAEGFLPADCATGYFGGMTLAALHAFQNKYAADILLPQRLDAPTDVFGSFSIAKANALCAPKI